MLPKKSEDVEAVNEADDIAITAEEDEAATAAAEAADEAVAVAAPPPSNLIMVSVQQTLRLLCHVCQMYTFLLGLLEVFLLMDIFSLDE